MIPLVRSLWSLLSARARRTFALMLVPILLTGVLETFSIAMLIPVLHALFDPGGVDSLPSIARHVVGPFRSVDGSFSISLVVGIFLLVFVVKNIVILSITYSITYVTQKYLSEFQVELMRIYLDFPYEYYLTRNSAEVVRNVISSAGRMLEAVRLMLNIALELLIGVFVLVFLATVAPETTATMVVVIALGGLGIHTLLGSHVHRWSAQVWHADKGMIQQINQSTGSIRDIQLTNSSEEALRGFKAYSIGMVPQRTLSSTAVHVPRFALEILCVVMFVGVIAFEMARGQSTADVLVLLGLFGMAGLRLLPSASRIVSSLTSLKRCLPDVEGLVELKTYSEAAKADMPSEPEHPIAVSGSIGFDGTVYQYPSGDRPSLGPVSVEFPAGSVLGVVGPSGSGKSTFLNVLLGFLVPSSGFLRVDGDIIDARTQAWRRCVAHVPQDIFLLDDTVERNIALGVAPEQVDAAKLARAIEQAGLAETIAALPDGSQTVLGERGSRLSGGQRQRIGIARALYSDSKVLVLDEVTSALDIETERQIIGTLMGLRGSMTIVIVTHRLDTVRRCDDILFLRDGKIEDQGPFDALVKRNPDFAALARDVSAQSPQIRPCPS
jgi:ABC-type multidrug transport system fused ATPase/permease subunit